MSPIISIRDERSKTWIKAEFSKDSVEEEVLHGHIDSFSAGTLTGWSASSASDEPLLLNVMCEGRIVGTARADIYRKDLDQAKIHEGFHVFSVALDDIVTTEKFVRLSLHDAESLRPILHSEFKMRTDMSDIFLGATRFSHGQIHTTLHAQTSLKNRKFVIYCDDVLVSTVTIYEHEKTVSLRVPLPASLLDGSEKLLKFGIEGYPNILGMEIVKCESIQTPWDHINNSYNKPGFLSLPKQAGHRYETLEYQIDAISKDKSPLAIKDLHMLHNVLVKSYENRRKYPPFNLAIFKNPRVSIIVPAYDHFALTYHCIASIAFAYNQTSYEVILADDCSSDETSSAEDIIGNLVISRNSENLRFLHNCNKATELAKGEYIVFLNNDTEVTSFWLDELVAVLDDDPKCGLTGSKLLNRDGSLQEAGGIVWSDGNPWNVGRNSNPILPEFNYVRDVDYLTGAAMCVRKDLWEEVGKFSEEFSPCYFEDTDLAFKVRNAGYKTVYTPFSEVVHFEGQSHGSDVTKGLKRNQVINQKKFGTKWFKAFRENGVASLDNLMIEKDRNIQHRVLFLDYATPQPDKDAGSYAAIQEIKMLQALGCKVTFVPENLAHFGAYTMDLQRMGVEVLYSPFYTCVTDVLNKRLAEMDGVYITRYTVAEKYIDAIRAKSDTRILFNNADLHFLRKIRASLSANGGEEGMQRALATRDAELDVCRKADAILSYTRAEHAVITSHIFEIDKLHLTPWVLDKKTRGATFEERDGVAFLGSYNHPPNREALVYLVNEVMPLLLADRPEIILSVYGSNMPEEFREYESENVKMVGFAKSLDDVFHNHRVFVAPLLSGAGIKGKVLEAMAYGLPCVLSEVAAEGTGLSHGISALVVDTPDAWVSAIERLYDDQKLWNKFSENEQLIAAEQYSFEHGVEGFRKILASVGLYS
jgi:GT2 family glycosyltransferase/glycosyltransferase involved in cell wall biosynthesis